MRAYFFMTPKGDEMAILPAADFRAMEAAIEDREDIAAVHEFRRKLAAGEEELIPAEVVDRILDGENKVRVWREYRRMTPRDLAAKVGLSAAYLSQIETGARDGRFETIKRIAEALGITVDDLARTNSAGVPFINADRRGGRPPPAMSVKASTTRVSTNVQKSGLSRSQEGDSRDKPVASRGFRPVKISFTNNLATDGNSLPARDHGCTGAMSRRKRSAQCRPFCFALRLSPFRRNSPSPSRWA